MKWEFLCVVLYNVCLLVSIIANIRTGTNHIGELGVVFVGVAMTMMMQCYDSYNVCVQILAGGGLVPHSLCQWRLVACRAWASTKSMYKDACVMCI